MFSLPFIAEASRALRAAFVGVLLAAVALGVSAAPRFEFDKAGGRLPKDVKPSVVRLALELDPARETFSGSVQIDLEVRKAVAAIVLNAHQLTAVRARLIDAAGRERALAVKPDGERQQWRLATVPAASIAAGHYTVAIDYTGRIENAGEGLFRVDYQLEGTPEPQRMLATQLQPAYARRVFPGFDEPAFRARFELSVTAPARYAVVSNMPPLEDRVDAGRRHVRFAPTPSMPSYLFALAVGEFDALEDEQDGVKLRILTAKGKREQGAFAMQATKQLLRYYADYFGVPFMLPKLDQLAVPGVRNGAMEDWGLISYEESSLLFDPAHTSPAAQRGIYNIVAHEVAHQWFGNYVTTGWWSDLWLNEAFATWMADKASEHFNPQWNLKLRERVAKEQAMLRDAGAATRPITVPIVSEDQFYGIFDEITYQKGGAVLTMFENALGPEVFREGLRRYMLAHAYSNAAAGDLWFHLSQASGRDVTGQIAAWVEQPGFPVLDVATRCVGERTEVALSQRRYSDDPASKAAGTWQVPVTLTAGAQTRALLLGRAPQTATFDGCAAPVLANAGDGGYFRVRYDAASFARLRAAFSTLPAADRIGLLADTYALAESGRIPFIDYLSLVAQGSAGREASEWRGIVERLESLDLALRGTPAQAALRAWSRQLLAPELARLGWAPAAEDDSQTLSLRADLIDVLGNFDDAATVSRARALEAERPDAGAVPPSVRGAVLYTVARHADGATFERLRAALKAATRDEDAWKLRRALTLVRDPALVERVLEISLTDEWEPTRAAWIARQAGPGSGAAELAYAFVEKHFAVLAAKAQEDGRVWLLPEAAAAFNQPRRADVLVVAQRRLLGEPGRDAAEQAAAGIRLRAGIRQREGGRLAGELAVRGQVSAAQPGAR